MRRTARLILNLLTVILLLTSCQLVQLDSSEMLPPEPGALALWKFWKYDSAYSLQNREKLPVNNYYMKLTAVVERNQVIIGDDIIEEPQIKVINVRTYDYFINRYRQTPEEVGIKAEYCDVYSITDSKGYSLRIFRLAEDRIAIERNNVLIFFKKVDNIADYKEFRNTDTQARSESNAVLLGLKGARETVNGLPGPSSMRTFLITMNSNSQVTAYEVRDIIFLKDSFHKLTIEREENIDVLVESIKLENLTTGQVYKDIPPMKNESRFVDLTFVSPSFISEIYRLSPDKSDGKFQYMATRSIDKLSSGNISYLGDIFGPEASQIYKVTAMSAITDNPNVSELKKNIDETSYILERQNGQWAYKGRVNFPVLYSDIYIDFSLSLRDNFRVFQNDTLKPQWARIKVLVPDAEDAVSSPEDFFTVVKTPKELRIYRRNSSGEIGNQPELTIPLKGNETIIMHQWATGNQVIQWTNFIRTLGNQVY